MWSRSFSISQKKKFTSILFWGNKALPHWFLGFFDTKVNTDVDVFTKNKIIFSEVLFLNRWWQINITQHQHKKLAMCILLEHKVYKIKASWHDYPAVCSPHKFIYLYIYIVHIKYDSSLICIILDSHTEVFFSTTQVVKITDAIYYQSMCTGECITCLCSKWKYFQWRPYCTALDMASSQVKKIFVFFRCGIWYNAWSKNQTRSQNFETEASNSLPNLSRLALFKCTSKWHQLWWSPWAGDHHQLSEASGLHKCRRLQQSSQEPTDGHRRREHIKPQKDTSITDRKVWPSCTGASCLAQEDGKGWQRFASLLVKGTCAITAGRLWAFAARMESSIHTLP